MKIWGGTSISKKLVAYFSVSGVIAKVAQEIAAVENAECFEIKPETPYTKEDLDWINKQSRSTLEMSDPNCCPAITWKLLSAKADGLSSPVIVGTDTYIAGKHRRQPHAEEAFEKLVL